MAEDFLSDKVILIIEDEEALYKAIKKKLDNLGCNTLTARSVKQALDYLEEGVQVDAVWLDHYLLGGESGLDFVVKVKEPDSPWHNIPVFVISNSSSGDKVEAYLKLGVSKYYVKAEHSLTEIVEDLKKTMMEADKT